MLYLRHSKKLRETDRVGRHWVLTLLECYLYLLMVASIQLFAGTGCSYYT